MATVGVKELSDDDVHLSVAIHWHWRRVWRRK